MNARRIVTMVSLAIACTTPALGAQATSPRGDNAKLNALRAIIAANQNKMSALAYVRDHPLSVTDRPLPAQGPLYIASPIGTRPPEEELRPQCPMHVARPAIKDSLPVSRMAVQSAERMPVAPSLCTNSDAAKR
jgi:hypothetical protein